jgi:hypothetical protein
MALLLSLSQYQQEEVFHFLKRVFSDFKFFESHAANPLKALISDSTKVEIDSLFVFSLTEKYIKNYEQYQSKEQKTVLETMKVVLTTAAVYLFSLHAFFQDQLYHSTQHLLEHYPQLKTQLNASKPEELKELQHLLRFRNYMVLALMLIPAKGNKTFLIRVLERLEGSNATYITGSGQKPAVTRRTDIYHQESGIEIAVKKVSVSKKRIREKEALKEPPPISCSSVSQFLQIPLVKSNSFSKTVSMICSSTSCSSSSAYHHSSVLEKENYSSNSRITGSSPLRKIRRQTSRQRFPTPPKHEISFSSSSLSLPVSPVNYPAIDQPLFMEEGSRVTTIDNHNNEEKESCRFSCASPSGVSAFFLQDESPSLFKNQNISQCCDLELDDEIRDFLLNENYLSDSFSEEINNCDFMNQSHK